MDDLKNIITSNKVLSIDTNVIVKEIKDEDGSRVSDILSELNSMYPSFKICISGNIQEITMNAYATRVDIRDWSNPPAIKISKYGPDDFGSLDDKVLRSKTLYDFTKDFSKRKNCRVLVSFWVIVADLLRELREVKARLVIIDPCAETCTFMF